MLYKLKKVVWAKLFFIGFTVCYVPQSSAVIEMVGKRVLFKAGATAQEVELRNDSDGHVLIQTWISAAPKGKMDNNSVPFIATPPVFKIGPKSRQKLRVILTNPAVLPQDKESLYYFHYQEIPTKPALPSGFNSIAISFDNVVKLIYRPKTINVNPHTVYQDLKAHFANKKLLIENPTNTYFSLNRVMINGKKISLPENPMVIPNGTLTLPISTSIIKTSNKIEIETINDFGGFTIKEIILKNK